MRHETPSVCRAQDVVELMDPAALHLSPFRRLRHRGNGSGVRAEAAALDDALPKAHGADAEAMNRFRTRAQREFSKTSSSLTKHI
jgi:hypothetical protein